MGPSTGDKSEILFRRLLLISLLSYFILAIGIELVPYTPDIEKIKSLRTVRLKETPLKGRLPVPIPAKPREKEQRIEEPQKRQEAEKKKLAADQKEMEEAQRLAERRQEEERRKEEELRRAEEERRLAKERNREAARNSGLLKAMKGEKRSLENIMSNEEMRNVLSETKLKSTKTQQDKTEAGTANQQKKVLKGSEGIGDVAGALPKTPSGSLSGQKRITGVDPETSSGQAMEHTGREGIGTGGKLGVRKARSEESIKEVVNAHRGGIDFLYKKGLRSNPTLKGVIVIEFTITPDGDVLSTRMVSTTINDPSFEEEVLKRVRSWKFPPYPDSGNTVVKYPIEFYPV